MTLPETEVRAHNDLVRRSVAEAMALVPADEMLMGVRLTDAPFRVNRTYWPLNPIAPKWIVHWDIVDVEVETAIIDDAMVVRRTYRLCRVGPDLKLYLTGETREAYAVTVK